MMFDDETKLLAYRIQTALTNYYAKQDTANSLKRIAKGNYNYVNRNAVSVKAVRTEKGYQISISGGRPVKLNNSPIEIEIDDGVTDGADMNNEMNFIEKIVIGAVKKYSKGAYGVSISRR